jgi:hypothetical protein
MSKERKLLAAIFIGVIGVTLGLNTGFTVFAEPSGGFAPANLKSPEQGMAASDESSRLGKKLGAIIEKVTVKDVCMLAEKYYKHAYPNLESDLQAEYHRLVPVSPVFDGKNSGSRSVLLRSADVALTISYTNAKNYYLALACAGFAANPQSLDAATNLATAVATYYDDLYFVGQKNSETEKEFYRDALRLYSYAIAIGAKTGQYGPKCLPALSSMGNLLLDMNRLEAAFTVFEVALEIDPTYSPARKGLYNYYMAKKQLKKALALLAEGAQFYPSVARAVAKISEDIKDDSDDEQGLDGDDDSESERRIAKLEEVPAVTTGNFIQYIDPAAAAKIKRDIDNLQTKMVYKAPDINFLTQYSSYEAAWSTDGRAAYLAVLKGLDQLNAQTVGQETETIVKKELDTLKQFGVGVDLGFDVDNLGEMINDAMKNPEKYENWEPSVRVSGTEGIAGQAKKYAAKMQQAITEVRNEGDSEAAYRELAKTRPEYQIMLINPYRYANPNDLLLQRYNIMALGNKRGSYYGYLQRKNTKTGETLNELMVQYKSKITPIITTYEAKKKEIEESNLDDDTKRVRLHQLHMDYYNKANKLGEPYWKQATETAVVSYKKIEKYAPRMYNDCLKHIMLVSDPAIRDRLEEELRTQTLLTVKTGINLVLQAYGFVVHYNPAVCDCDTAEIMALKKKIEEETRRKTNEQIKKNIQAKKNFEQGILDENSQYYKNFIEKYECNYNFVIFKGKLSPYKSYNEFNIGAFGTNFNLKSVTNHIRNTTTYDGGLSLGLSEGPVGARTYLQFSATQGGNGFTLTDTTWGLETSAGIGPASATAAFEASALRGTRVCTQAAVTGDSYLDKLKLEVVGNTLWKPDINTQMWNYEYATDWSNQ